MMTEVSCRAGLKWDGGSKKHPRTMVVYRISNMHHRIVNQLMKLSLWPFNLSFFSPFFILCMGIVFFMFFLYDSFVVKLLTLHYFTLFQGYCHTTQRLWWSRNWPLTSPLRMVWQFQATKPISLWQKPSKQGSWGKEIGRRHSDSWAGSNGL